MNSLHLLYQLAGLDRQIAKNEGNRAAVEIHHRQDILLLHCKEQVSKVSRKH